VADADGYADGGRRDGDGVVAHDFVRLVDHFGLFLAVAVGPDLPVVGQDVVGELSRMDA
jgi:hypothetical protein